MGFIILVFSVWLLYCYLLNKKMEGTIKFSQALLPLVLFSYLVTIDLGINYLAGAIPKLNDGIGLHSRFAFFIIGDNRWSIELFKTIYDISFFISLILTFIYAGLSFIKPKK